MAFVAVAANADDKDQKGNTDNGTADNIRQPDPPAETTGTVKTPQLQPYDGHTPEPKFKEPPPPKTDKNDDKK